MLGTHAEELLKRRVIISPVVVAWRYKIATPEDFTSWLSTREILLSESRMSGDVELKGVRYGGTYRVAGEKNSASFKTIWGYTSEAAMHAMNRLCSDDSVSATLVQLELIEFVKGLRRFIAEAGTEHFSEEIMISAAAGQACSKNWHAVPQNRMSHLSSAQPFLISGRPFWACFVGSLLPPSGAAVRRYHATS